MRPSEAEVICPHCYRPQVFDTEMETGWTRTECDVCGETMFVDSTVEISAEAFATQQSWMQQTNDYAPVRNSPGTSTR